MKIFCYGVQKIEEPIFNKSNIYQHQIIYTKEFLNKTNWNLVPVGTEAIILFVNCHADEENLMKFKKMGVKYILTRTAGYDHIDLNTATKLGYNICHVPAYSPTSVGSLAFSLGISMIRKSGYMIDQSLKGDFKIKDEMFAKEFKNLTVGILGTGKIGFEVAKMFAGIGANVLGYDIYPRNDTEGILKYENLDKIIKTADILSVHVPYIKGKTDNFINKDFLNKVKKDAVIINVSRKNLVDHQEILIALKENRLAGYGADVFLDEESIINNKFTHEELTEKYPIFQELLKLHPKVLITPHVAYFTDEAVKNMADVTFSNLYELEKFNKCANSVNMK